MRIASLLAFFICYPSFHVGMFYATGIGMYIPGIAKQILKKKVCHS
jgi:hypothetical protein